MESNHHKPLSIHLGHTFQRFLDLLNYQPKHQSYDLLLLLLIFHILF
nr:MAG TPA: hypothetical protein [Caudoviricetes sp.]